MHEYVCVIQRQKSSGVRLLIELVKQRQKPKQKNKKDERSSNGRDSALVV
jgi:hypothetical protein